MSIGRVTGGSGVGPIEGVGETRGPAAAEPAETLEATASGTGALADTRADADRVKEQAEAPPAADVASAAAEREAVKLLQKARRMETSADGLDASNPTKAGRLRETAATLRDQAAAVALAPGLLGAISLEIDKELAAGPLSVITKELDKAVEPGPTAVITKELDKAVEPGRTAVITKELDKAVEKRGQDGAPGRDGSAIVVELDKVLCLTAGRLEPATGMPRWTRRGAAFPLDKKRGRKPLTGSLAPLLVLSRGGLSGSP